jgi:predicted RecB family nuclease
MKITSYLFEAYLKCPTKCFLRSLGEVDRGNAYANWVKTRNESYRREGLKRLMEGVLRDECVISPTDAGHLKTSKWRLSVDLVARAQNLESGIHAVERLPSEGPGQPSQFIPIRFSFTNKVTRDDKLLVAFDALSLSKILDREVSQGKIIHGDDQAPLKVKIPLLAGEVRKLIGKSTALLSNASTPDLVLNRHCPECEFQVRCRQKAVEKDDLSLLSGMTEKERKKYNSKGIFTVTQLSYTFRPRRRPRRLATKREKYHHSLKALAIRERKVHIVGNPELKIEGTPVYVDVEGLPDRDFYYLIGVRVKNADGVVPHSLWADSKAEEKRIWTEFLGVLSGIENPVLIHYGRFETTFLKRMCQRYGEPPEGSVAFKAIATAVNVLPVIYAQVYFPAYSNGLKAVADWLGFRWSAPDVSGAQTVNWRHEWERTRDTQIKQRLVMYNSEDCQALELVERTIHGLCPLEKQPKSGNAGNPDVVCADSVKPDYPYRLGHKTFAMPELEEINKAAYWNYQRARVYVRSGKRLREKRTSCRSTSIRVNKVVVCPAPTNCPHCNRIATEKRATREKLLYDLRIGRFSVKRWVVKYGFQTHWCPKCKLHFGLEKRFRKNLRFGWNLVAYFLYQVVELCIPQRIVTLSINRLFGFNLGYTTVSEFKSRAADFYENTKQQILDRIVRGRLVHADETRANIKGKLAYVWVLTNLHEVAYIYAESREGGMVQNLLREFKGVLVSDFYAAYDSIQCPQQKCLIHLMRDLNDETLNNPFDEELKRIVGGFAELLRPIVQTVDRHGLKSHFLRKYLPSVDRFYKKLIAPSYQSAAAIKCKERFEKNCDKLFTFLRYDGVPWNNNNAEHAIKAFARLRDVMGGTSTEKGIEEYLTLLTVSETCKYQGLDFLNFLRSGEKDFDAFGDSKRRRASKSVGDSGKQAMMVDGATDFYALIRKALDLPRGDERTALLNQAMEKCPSEMLALVKQDPSLLDARLLRRQSTRWKGTPKKRGFDFYALIRKALDLPRGDERTALLNRTMEKYPNEMRALVKRDASVPDARLVPEQSNPDP